MQFNKKNLLFIYILRNSYAPQLCGVCNMACLLDFSLRAKDILWSSSINNCTIKKFFALKFPSFKNESVFYGFPWYICCGHFNRKYIFQNNIHQIVLKTINVLIRNTMCLQLIHTEEACVTISFKATFSFCFNFPFRLYSG